MKAIPIRSIKSQELNAKLLENFKIRSIREVLSGKEMNQDLHRHDFFFILAVRKGKGSHEIDFIKYPVTDYTVFFLRPGQVHQLQLKAGSEGYIMEFSKDFQIQSTSAGKALLNKAAANLNFYKLNKNNFPLLNSSLQSMLEEFSEKQEGYENVIKANLEIFLTHLLRYRQHSETACEKANHYQQEKLQEVMHLLETHISTVKNVSAYADMVHLSPFQLNSITKNLIGKTVAQLIEDQILLEAKRYLLATSNQVNQIAFQLGYDDVSYFIRFFKKLTGQTPEAFRKNFQ